MSKVCFSHRLFPSVIWLKDSGHHRHPRSLNDGNFILTPFRSDRQSVECRKPWLDSCSSYFPDKASLTARTSSGGETRSNLVSLQGEMIWGMASNPMATEVLKNDPHQKLQLPKTWENAILNTEKEGPCGPLPTLFMYYFRKGIWKHLPRASELLIKFELGLYLQNIGRPYLTV